MPGCWTEGLAFDLLSAITWLLVNPKRLPGKWNQLMFGTILGLLCLDRSVFVLTIIPLCILWAFAAVQPPMARLKTAGITLALSILVQLPWWIRNVSISGRFLPLGTQGGFNLPDQYSDTALSQSSWTGTGMVNAWTPLTIKDSEIRPPAGFTEESFQKLSGGSRREKALFAATFCTSLQSEIAVSDRGMHAGLQWIRSNYAKIPRLMLLKAQTLIAYFHPRVIASAALSLLGFIVLPKARRVSVYALLIAAIYVLAVSLTHVVLARFLVPILPMLFLGDAIGAAAIARLIANMIRSTHAERRR